MIKRAAVYRAFAADAILLYVGVADNFGGRWTTHAATKPWWPEAVRLTVDWYPSRPEAEAAEAAAIHAEHPVHNVTHNRGSRAEDAGSPCGLAPPALMSGPADLTPTDLLALTAMRKACTSGRGQGGPRGGSYNAGGNR